MQPPGDVKLELRNRFDSIRHHRNPFDGSLSRDTVATYSASSVIDVPGKKPGSVSSDLKYGVTVHLVGRPAASDATAALARITDATHVLERGVGEDLAPLQRKPDVAYVVPSSAAPAPAHNMPDRVALMDQTLGRDIRGRLMSEDLREFIRLLKADFPEMAADLTTDDQIGWTEEQRQRLKWFKAYWAEYPALTHNRELFTDFLAKNHLPLSTAHKPEVIALENALLDSLKSDKPSEQWWRQARALREAYAQERSALVKSRLSAARTDLVFSPRSTPCPAAETTNTGTSSARMREDTRSLLDYWPLESRRLGEEGTVIAALRISETGCATSMTIVGSSGSDLMDGAVVKYLESMQFIPAGTGGRAVESEMTVPVVFKLN
jgi:TonB family protein